eukprot:CAMPEP_0113934642 /NCGR_PEP_ID=MMETSP1339-20121228/1939_1 /TAXON_ID=94617 /ORGANISM="Fibrocapsa japonica" /LENGTH=216 /DNA_ID=CAMNT_0000936523 /DNA_START=80 /DNA_END=730 /DNA_ORIENTATION=- /assembly_acc=CAM_ASM_000762
MPNFEDGYNLKPGEVSTGTTIMACEYEGGVVVGADSRTSTGTYVANRASNKVTYLADNIFGCRSGSAADTEAVTDYVKYFLESHSTEIGGPPRVRSAAHLVRKLCYENKDALMAGMIIGGWDPVDGGQVYSVPLGGTLMRQPVAIGGSGSTYIYGHVDAAYRPGMSKEECHAFVAKAISHAMARDGSSGGVIRLVSIDANGIEKQYFAGDKLPYGP